jgi:hypothetical protein
MIKELILIAVAALIVITKFFDCYTTRRFIVTPYGEKNPIARKLMLTLGIKNVIWGTFLLTILITSISYYGSIYYESFLYDTGFIIIGILVSAIQAAVVHTNYTGKINLITKILLKIY